MVILSCVCLLCIVTAGCSSPSATQTPAPAKTSSPMPTATQKPSDIWNDTTVFATLDKLGEDSLLATAAGEQRTYLFGTNTERQIEALEIQEGNSVAIHFEIDDNGNYLITSIEKMLVGR